MLQVNTNIIICIANIQYNANYQTLKGVQNENAYPFWCFCNATAIVQVYKHNILQIERKIVSKYSIHPALAKWPKSTSKLSHETLLNHYVFLYTVIFEILYLNYHG